LCGFYPLLIKLNAFVYIGLQCWLHLTRTKNYYLLTYYTTILLITFNRRWIAHLRFIYLRSTPSSLQLGSIIIYFINGYYNTVINTYNNRYNAYNRLTRIECTPIELQRNNINYESIKNVQYNRLYYYIPTIL